MPKRFRKIYLEIGNVCNLSCSFCPTSRRKKRILSSEEFALIAEKIRPYTDYLYLHVLGEPLCHPALADILCVCERLGFRVVITTNGTLLTQKQSVLLSSPAVYKVNISLHSFEANDDANGFDEYLDRCFSFADKATESGILTVFRLWNDGGQNTLNDAILQKMHAYFPLEFVSSPRGTRIKNNLYCESAEKFEWPLSSSYHSERVTCRALSDQIAVLSDGTVVPCCLDHDGNASLGNLFSESMEDILHKKSLTDFRKALDARVAPCEMCTTCGFAIERFR